MVRVHYSNSGKLVFGDFAAGFGLVRLALIIDLSMFLRSQVERYICEGNEIDPRIDLISSQLNPTSNQQIVRHKSCLQRQ